VSENLRWHKVLITGGAGFIGSHVAEFFTKIGKDVHIADRFSYAGKFRNIAGVVPESKIWYGNFQDKDFCEKLADYPWDVVVHLGGNTHVDRSIADPVTFTKDNVLGTNQILQALHQRNTVKKVVVYSTDEVFGSTPEGQIFAEDAKFNPSNAYSASKVGIEAVVMSFWTTHRLPLNVVRPCNTYGPRQHPEKVIARFTSQCLRGHAMTVHNDGQGGRDWLWCEDNARAIRYIIERGQDGHSYNLAAGDEHKDIELAEMIGRLVGKPYNINYVMGRPGHDRRYWMDSTKLRNLGWKPTVGFDQGLAETVNWTMKNEDWWEHDWVPARIAASVR